MLAVFCRHAYFDGLILMVSIYDRKEMYVSFVNAVVSQWFRVPTHVFLQHVMVFLLGNHWKLLIVMETYMFILMY